MIRLAILQNLPRPPKPPQPELKTLSLYWLFGSTLFVLSPHLLRLPLWLGSVTVGLIVWRLLCLGTSIKPPGWLINGLLALGLVGLVLMQYQTIFGRTAGSALLVAFAGLKVLETTTLRDAMFGAILLMVLVMANFLFDQSPTTAVYGLGGMLLIIGNLNMLVAPQQFNLRQALRFTLKILLHGIPLALVAYLLFPRIEGSLWGLAEDPYSGVTGLSDHIAPGSLNNLSRSNEVAFRVEFTGHAPEPDQLYWRTLVLELTDGRRWQRAPLPAAGSKIKPTTNSSIVGYRITLEASGKRWLPLMEQGYSTDRRERINASGTLIASRPIRDRIRYRGTSITQGLIAEQVPAEYNLKLYNGISERVMDLANQFRQRYDSKLELARAVTEYFTEQEFYYTLNPPLLGENPVDEFLFESRAGYCEHYASAFAVLMRAAGIPARVVLGYQGGEANDNGDYHIVRQSNAHAWNEIWIAGQGWVRVDPTAAVAPERIRLGINNLLDRDSIANNDNLDGETGFEGEGLFDSFGYRLELAIDGFTHRWNQWVLSYGPEQQRAFLKRLGFSAPDWGWMLLTLFIISSLFLFATFILLNRPGRHPEGPGKYYRQFKKQLSKSGMNIKPWQGPLDLTAAASQRFPDEAGRINHIADLYSAIVYGNMNRKEDLENLKKQVRNFKPGNNPRANQ